MNRGKFITLEGTEGVGKTTNLRFIQNFLQQQAIDLVVTREPGGTQLAEKIRTLLLEHDGETITKPAELLLVFAARAQHIHHVIEPALQEGKWVVCDRFTDASYAYQGGGRNMEYSAIAWLENFVQTGLRPDLTLLLDAPLDIGMERAKKRQALDRFEAEHLNFFTRVREAYLQQASLHPNRIVLINANATLAQVQAEIAGVLKKLFA